MLFANRCSKDLVLMFKLFEVVGYVERNHFITQNVTGYPHSVLREPEYFLIPRQSSCGNQPHFPSPAKYIEDLERHLSMPALFIFREIFGRVVRCSYDLLFNTWWMARAAEVAIFLLRSIRQSITFTLHWLGIHLWTTPLHLTLFFNYLENETWNLKKGPK